MTDRNYGYIVETQEIKTYLDKIIQGTQVFAFDIESGYDGPDPKTVSEKISLMPYHPQFKVVGFSFTDDMSWARYIPISHDEGPNANTVAVARMLWVLLNTGRGVAHNASFELAGMGRFFRDNLWDDTFFASAVRKARGFFPMYSDSMIEAFMTQKFQPAGPAGGPGVGLKGLTKFEFGHDQVEFEALFVHLDAKRRRHPRFNHLKLTAEVVSYACEDSVWCLGHHERNYPEVSEMFMFKVEVKLLTVLAEMEYAGLALDWAEYERRAIDVNEFKNKMNEEIQTELSDRLGEVVNVNLGSPKQVADLLYTRLGLPVQLDRKTKKPSTGEVALRNLVREHPILKRILQWREVDKLLGSYITKYRDQLSYAEDGRAHPNHKQTGAATGRMSVDHVSYQQWPKPYEFTLDSGEELHLNYRNFLVAPEGFRIVGYDFSQVELRVLAGMADEKDLLHAFNTDVDVHKQTASTMKKIPLEDVTEKDRADGKTLNFAVVYGSGADNIASMLGVTVEEAQQMLDDYFAAFSGLRGWMDARVLEGQQNGVVYTHFGRKFKVWEYVDAARNAEKAQRVSDPEEKDRLTKMSRIARSKGDRMCVNAPVQGGAADYMKIGMVRVQKAIKEAGLEDKIVLIMTIHDALEFYVHESVTTQEVIDLVSPQVTFRVTGLPVIRADWHEGKRWGEVVEIKLDENQKISGYEWKKTEYSTLDEAYAAQEAKNAEANEKQVWVKSSEYLVVHITLPEAPEESQWKKFRTFLRQHPGPAKVVVHLPDGDKELDATTLLFSADVQKIKELLSDSEVEFKREAAEV